MKRDISKGLDDAPEDAAMFLFCRDGMPQPALVTGSRSRVSNEGPRRINLSSEVNLELLG